MRALPEPGGGADPRTALAFAALRDVNEQLVLSAIRAQLDAEATARQAGDAARAADLDPLTGLPRRTLMLDRFGKAAAIAKRHGTRLGVLFVDLNNFKQVNDALGHAIGDAVLQRAASCLISGVRDADTVSRHGGDEFVVLLTDIATPADAGWIAEKLGAALAVPVRVGEHVIRLTASVGISLFPDDGEDAATLIDRADGAMFRAKRRGAGGHAFFGDDAAPAPGIAPAELTTLLQPVVHVPAALSEYDRRNAALREANEQLVLAALSAQALQAEAEAAQRRQTEFMAVLAHELRNPLAPMRNVAAMLTRMTPDDPLLPKLQGIIERQVVHMARLVDDLLDVSRATTGKLHLQLEAVDMTTVIADAIDACRPSIDVRLQRFAVSVPPVALFVHGDRVRLTQVITNLLDNASRYTPGGGDLSLSLVAVDDLVVVTVADSGIGIAPAALPKVFDLFAQDFNAVGFRNLGLGIGLTVVHELVTAHGGTVSAHSDGAGRGSEFVVRLPRSGGPATG